MNLKDAEVMLHPSDPRWGWLDAYDRKTEREKLAAALDIFSELNMARERGAVRAELEKTTAAYRAT